MNKSAKTVAFLGVFGALIFVVLLLETQVFAAILPVSPCYLSLPLAISLCLYGDYKNMFIGGTILGLCSFIMSFMFPQFIMFANPLISVLPRLLLGIVAYFVCELAKIIFKKENKFCKTVPYVLAGIFGAITNTVLVVSGLFIFGFTGIETALASIISFNALIEIVCSAILVPIIVFSIKRYKTVGEK
ncbi:MAG: ECF transporter S component [Clostridia bacterium]|nr:ECF transporter S component [Clostridia bacterium]